MITEMLVENPFYGQYYFDRNTKDEWIKVSCIMDEYGIFYPYYNREQMTNKLFACRVKSITPEEAKING